MSKKTNKKTYEDAELMNRKAMTAADLAGVSIWRDFEDHILKRVVYSNILMKDGYVITDDDARTFSLYHARTAASEVAFLILFLLTRNFLLSLCIPLAFFAVTSILFFVKYLPTLEHIETYIKPKNDKTKPEYAAGKYQTYYAVFVSGLVSLAVLLYYMVNSANPWTIQNLLFVAVAVALTIYGYIKKSDVKQYRRRSK